MLIQHMHIMRKPAFIMCQNSADQMHGYTDQRLCFRNIASTVSHFSYAPLFQGPHFLDKNAGIEHCFNYLLIDIFSVR